jgi:hypothetical protein
MGKKTVFLLSEPANRTEHLRAWFRQQEYRLLTHLCARYSSNKRFLESKRCQAVEDGISITLLSEPANRTEHLRAIALLGGETATGIAHFTTGLFL